MRSADAKEAATPSVGGKTGGNVDETQDGGICVGDTLRGGEIEGRSNDCTPSTISPRLPYSGATTICGQSIRMMMRVIGGARWNQIFENPLLPLNVKPIGGTDRFVEGWDLVR